jgi:lipase chaperone LimK
MSLGGYTFEKNPSEMTVIKSGKIIASVLTYSSVAVFSWGTLIAGKTLDLRWKGMSLTMFEQLQTLYEADASVAFFPDIDSGTTYTVEIMKFNGDYHLSQSDAADYRVNVEMDLLILS